MSAVIAPSAILRGDVSIGDESIVEDYCILGAHGSAGSTRPAAIQIGRRAYIRSFAVIYAGCIVGDRFQTGNKVNIRDCCTIGNDVSIGSLTVIEHHVTIEDGVRIHSQAFVPEFTLLRARAWIGPNVVLTNCKFPRSRGAKSSLAPVTIGEAAIIGANATVLPGVTVGRMALVGAGAVVVRDVPERAVIVGNPGRHIRVLSSAEYGDEAHKLTQ